MAFPAAGGVGLLRHSERLEAVGLRVEEEYALVDMAQYRVLLPRFSLLSATPVLILPIWFCARPTAWGCC